jgi:acyl transferase domain-containing protein/surfactin synthase thioesterase subunit/D-arabinose 1-dehydrogenase-like Zn-dependent alcohol dehydrogenase/acyl carrier protein
MTMTSSLENKPKDQLRTTLARALAEVERLRKKVASLELADHEPIAVVGVGVQLPGGVVDLESLWSALEGEVDAVREVPADRWDVERYYDPEPATPGKTYTREAGFLDRVDAFDPGFFKISPREARNIDPQHRLLLEASWESLENAGVVPGSVRGARAGVYVGLGPSDYGFLQQSSGAIDAYTTMGTHTAFGAGRIAYHLGLRGPAITVDTACSSSLVALHLACNALRAGECELALAASSQVITSAHFAVQLSQTRALAPDGRSKTFSANADGYGRGEGVVALVLERLSDARKHGRRIHALIRGSAVNHDGASSGITAPNGRAQQEVLRAALEDARLRPLDVDVVECHGTGTELGDPIEVRALASVYGPGRGAERPLLLGAIKTNIGHLESAAGLAGVVKMIAAMGRGAVPATLHTQPPNPHIEWSELPVEVVDRLRPWPDVDGVPRRAGVSAFGLSGTNAHVILEGAPKPERVEAGVTLPTPPRDLPVVPILLSARDEGALRAQAARLHEQLLARGEPRVLDLAYSLATTRTHFEVRACMLGAGKLPAALTELAKRGLGSHAIVGEAKLAPKLALLFTGQGAQRLSMGKELHRTFPVFRRAFDELCAGFDGFLDRPLGEVMFAAEGSRDAALLDQTAYTQPALFTLEVALFRLLESWGIRPDVLLGHSIGELAAAHVAGVFCLDDACKLVGARGRLMQALPAGGAMVSIAGTREEVASVLAEFAGVDIAAVNGPMSTVVSGDERAVLEVAARFESEGRQTRRLDVSHAFHSHRMEGMLEAFAEVAASITYAPAQIPIISNLSGEQADPASSCRPEYWVEHVRGAVRFYAGVRTLEALGVDVLLELGPHGVLSSMAAACLSDEGEHSTARVTCLRKDRAEASTLVGALAKLHCHGVEVDWQAFFAPYDPRRVELPSYAFARERYWIDDSPATALASTSSLRPTGRYPLSGHRVDLGNDVVLHLLEIGPGAQSYIGDHVVYGHIVIPGAFYAAVLLAVAESHWPDQPIELRHVEFIRALTFSHRGETALLHVELLPANDGSQSLVATLFTEHEGERVERAKAVIGPAAADERPPTTDLRAGKTTWEEIDVDELDDSLRRVHVEWGPTWWWVRQLLRTHEQAVVGRFSGARGVPVDAPLPAGLIDNSFGFSVWTSSDGSTDGTPQLPFSIERLVWSGRHELPVDAELVPVASSADSTSSNLVYRDAAGATLAWVEGFTTRRAPIARFIRSQAERDLYVTQWREVSVPSVDRDARRFASIGEHLSGLGSLAPSHSSLEAFLAQLDADGVAPEVVAVILAAGGGTLLSPTLAVLSLLETWLADERLVDTRLVVVTRRAISTSEQEGVADLPSSCLWGLLRVAQAEHGERPLGILDTDDTAESRDLLLTALSTDEPQLAIRNGALLAPRLIHPRARGHLDLPPGTWHLDIPRRGTIENLTVVEQPAEPAPLPAGHVRVAPRVAGLNFRDVINVLDMYPGDPGPPGVEGSGVIVEVAPDVSTFAPGDRVMGQFPSAYSNLAIADAHQILKIPPGWSFAEAATVPVAYLTAYYGIVVLGRLQPGESILIHAGAGGVGIAATQLALHLGAEVFATASPKKWSTLRSFGLADDHIASSRTLDFEAKFRSTTGGRGVDLVLNSLAGEFLDASLRLLAPGGRLLEMGKTDLRDPEVVAGDYPEIRYLPFDILDIPPAQTKDIFANLYELFNAEALLPIPFSTWDIRQAPLALRHMAQARHVGKLVLTIPRPLDPGPLAGTALITGGTGALGALVARHLVSAHGVQNLVLCSRRGPAAPAAAELVTELEALGAAVRLVACDVADRDALAELLTSIPAEHPLTAVFHTAGVLDDHVLEALTPESFELVFRSKVSGAWHLHELTAKLDLSVFVLFSSIAGVLGSPGQGNYAAANTYLDALAAHRRSLGLPALSLAWGAWAQVGMAARLSDVDRTRLKRQGIPPLSPDDGLALLDAALARPEPVLAPVRLDENALSRATVLSPVLRDLVQVAARRAAPTAAGAADSFAQRLAAMPEDARARSVLDLVRGEAATVLALPSPESIDPGLPLEEFGLDSLMAIELRNRLQGVTGLRLSSTLLFDYPTPGALARELRARLLDEVAPSLDARVVTPTSPPPGDEIAIVAMACRFPGGAESPEDLWGLLADGRDLISSFPTDRGWRLDELHHPDPDHPGTTYARGGGFLERPDCFDASFFGISPREAEAIDPQQRLLLELSWEALERASIDPLSLVDSPTGVYVGVCYHDYLDLAPPPSDAKDGYAFLGTLASTASGRISYALGLRGPAVSVDTACSTSLVALHLASQALRNGECNLALVGGATMFATPEPFIIFSRLKTLSRDGRCRAFSVAADGAGWSEGAGVLVLERLRDAQERNHPVLALVRGSAINQDGRSQGLTAPNGPSQQQLIQAALASADLRAADVDVVEAHGTGTRLGDSIEVGALLNTYGRHHSKDKPLWLGSIKSNFGHTQAAAGVAGVIKVVMAMRRQLLPRTLHAEEPMPEIDWSSGGVRLLDEARPWKRGEHPRRAAVSSFGISGTNAHIILEEAPIAEEPARRGAAAPLASLPILLSARSEGALAGQAARLRAHLDARGDLSPLDLAYSLATTRSHFEYRACLGTEGLGAALDDLAERGPGSQAVVAQAKRSPRLALLFTGQGAQRLSMGAGLREAFPSFRASFDEACTRFDAVLDQPLQAVIFAEKSSKQAALLDQTAYAQPALFVLEVALYRLLESWGVRAHALLGHSVGELAAAHVAGVVSLDDACKLVAARGRLMQALPPGGAMVSIQATEDEVASSLEHHEGVDIAAVNGPVSTVVSGDEAPTLALAAHFEARGRKTSRLAVSHAFHSRRMDAMLEDLHEVAASLTYQPPRIPVVSCVSGELVEAETLCSPAYWVRHAREAVRFFDGIRALEDLGAGFMLELGPRGVLSPLAAACLSDDAQPSTVTAPTLRPDKPEVEALVAALGGLHCHGVGVDWGAFFEPFEPMRVELPTYAFVRQRHWLTGRRQATTDLGAAGLGVVDHRLLGAVVSVADSDTFLFTARLSLADHPWLADHVVFGQVLFPSTGFLELAVSAGARVGASHLDELSIPVPLILSGDDAAVVQLRVGAPDEAGRRRLSIHARPESASASQPWTEHAFGTISVAKGERDEGRVAWPPPGAIEVELDGLHARLAHLGLGYGPTFRGLVRAWQAGEVRYAQVRLPSDCDVEGFAIHPALLDAALHALALDADSVSLPFAWSGVDVHAAGASSLLARLTPGDAAGTFAIDLATTAGRTLASVVALATRPASPADLREALTKVHTRDLYRVDWEVRPREEHRGSSSSVVSFGGEALGAATVVESIESIENIESLEVTPELALLSCLEVGTSALEASTATLEFLQRWLASERVEGVQLAVVTRRAISTGPGDDVLDLGHAPVWGLVRAAQSEHPDLPITLIDVDEPSEDLLDALASGEPQLAIRGGRVLVPRLAPVTVTVTEEHTRVLDPEGTVLITGATGALGSVIARHLVEHHGVRQLLLVSRRGPDSPAAAELRARLEAFGAQVRLEACDVAERDAVAAVIDSIPSSHPLTAVFHAAGVLDDGVLSSLTPAHLERVFQPKVLAAEILHELTEHLELSAFVLFSSVTGLLGTPGQGNYAAANTYLDALAAHRHARGLPATSLAWGPWAQGGMAARLSEADVARLRRSGLLPMTSDHGLRLLDAALGRDLPLLAPVRLDVDALAELGAGLPPLLRAIVPVGPVSQVASGSAHAGLAHHLAPLALDERRPHVLELVRSTAAQVLGQADPASVPADQPLQELGLDSLMAVELRNRLQAVCGLRLPVTLLFNHPTAAALADLLLAELQAELERLTSDELTSKSVVETESRASRRDSNEPIAIVAMACRYPGGVRDPESLWHLVDAGRDAISEFPGDRGWPHDLYDPDPWAAGKSTTHEGGFLLDAAEFDPGFFGVSPREAAAIDPQQRLLLEVCWEVLERAGLRPAALRGSSTGAFIGIMYSDYGGRLLGDLESLAGHVGVGSSPAVASGRIAYTFGFEGPTLTIDTACSSSLVAVHLAAQALRNGECDLALAGGATVMATPAPFVEFSRQRGLSPNGRCKSFSAGADGVGWGEGVGVLLLERLSDAKANGHRVLALVRGSAVNQDGRSQGLTAPNGPAQQRLITDTLATARLAPADIDVVEGHGTGTRIGDPIEVEALLATYGRARPSERPLWLGSIKSNIGHTQAASGVAGIIKMVQAMKHEQLPRSLYADEPSPHVDWSSGAVRLLDEAQPWKRGRRLRRAAVSSFGISGTNAHVILEEAPPAEAVAAASSSAPPYLPVLLSGRTDEAVRAGAKQLAEALDSPLLDVAFTLATRRSHHDRRATLVARSHADARRSLADLAVGRGELTYASRRPKVAFLFSGQGSQRVGMGAGLRAAYPGFRDALDEICSHFDPRVREVLFAEESSEQASLLSQTAFTQPALFALELALVRLFASWGVVPELLLGHSIGELVAAHVAGVMSLEDACELVSARGRLMQAQPRGGAMIAIEASEFEVRSLLTRHAGVDIAALNGPTSTVISGDDQAARVIAAHFERLGRSCRELRVSHAFHSHRMDGMLEELRVAASSLELRAPSIPLVSNLDGKLAGSELSSPDYWVDQVRHTVRFAEGVRTLQREGATVFLELGPHAVLTTMSADCLTPGEKPIVSLPAMRSGRPEAETLALALASLHSHGVEVDWAAYFEPHAAKPVALPTYPFQRQRYWLDPRGKGDTKHDPAISELWHALEQGSEGLAASLNVPADRQWTFEEFAAVADDWRRAHVRDEKIAAWLYRETWTPVSPVLPASVEGREPEVPLFVLPAGLDPAIEEALLGDEGTPALVIDTEASSEDLASRLRTKLEEREFAAIVCLTALDEAALAPEKASTRGVLLSLHLVRALASLEQHPPLCLVTRGAVAIDASEAVSRPAQAMLWGLGRVVSLERPSAWARLVDLPEHLDADVGARLRQLCVRRSDEDQLALRSTKTYGRRLTRAAHPGDAPPLRGSGVALVTGGTGGLGAHAARWLASRGIDRLVLTSRRGPDAPGSEELCAELERAGTSVSLVRCDIADRTELAALLARIRSEGGELTTVIHAAGVPGTPVLVSELSDDELLRVCAAKADGAHHLHELTRDDPVRTFILYGSGAGSWGGAQQGAYAAANAYLDGLARHRQASGLPATTISWGAWQGAGMSDGDVGRQLALRGVRPMEAELAMRALEIGLSCGGSLTVADIDWQRFAPLYAAQRPRPLLNELPEAREALAPAPTEAKVRRVLSRLSLAELRALGVVDAIINLARSEDDDLADEPPPMSGDPSLLRAQMRELAAEILRMRADEIATDLPLTAYGFDSLMALELRTKLADGGVEVSAAEVLRGTSIDELVARITAETPSRSDAPSSSPWIVIDRPNPDCDRRLVCFPYAAGGPAVYGSWSSSLGPDYEVAIVHLPGRGSRLDEPASRSIADVVEPIVAALLGLADKPLVLFGHCMGAMVMMEVAERLEHDHGVIPERIFASAAAPPSHYQSPAIHRFEEDDLLQVLQLVGFAGVRVLTDDAEARRVLMPMLKADFEAVATYSRDDHPLRPVSAPLVVIAALRDVFVAPRFIPGWSTFSTGEISYELIDDHHYFVESRRDEVLELIKQLSQHTRSRPPNIEEVAREDWNAVTDAAQSRVLALDPVAAEGDGDEWLLTHQAPAANEVEVTVVLIADLLAAPFPLADTTLGQPTARVIELRPWTLIDRAPADSSAWRFILEVFTDFVRDQTRGPLILAGQGFGALSAAEIGAVVDSRLLHMFVVGAPPPGHYGMPFLDLLDDEELRRCLRVAGHPLASAEDLGLVRSGLRAASHYPSNRSVSLRSDLTVIRSTRDLLAVFHSHRHWRDLTTGTTRMITHDGGRFDPLDGWLLPAIRRVPSPVVRDSARRAAR